jgi:hypothetical protein
MNSKLVLVFIMFGVWGNMASVTSVYIAKITAMGYSDRVYLLYTCEVILFMTVLVALCQIIPALKGVKFFKAITLFNYFCYVLVLGLLIGLMQSSYMTPDVTSLKLNLGYKKHNEIESVLYNKKIPFSMEYMTDQKVILFFNKRYTDRINSVLEGMKAACQEDPQTKTK